MLRLLVFSAVFCLTLCRSIDYNEIDRLLYSEKGDVEVALENLKEEISDENNSEVLWRLAQAEHELRKYETHSKKQEKLQKKALKYAKKAMEIGNQEDGNVHKWYAISLGGMTDFVSNKERVRIGNEFEEEIRKAIKLNPNDHELHYLLGRFLLQVSQLGWIERSIASALFGEPPKGTVKGSIEEFLIADRLSEGKYIPTKFYLAKAYIEQEKYKPAMRLISEGLEMNPVSHDERETAKELKTLMKKYRRYA